MTFGANPPWLLPAADRRQQLDFDAGFGSPLAGARGELLLPATGAAACCPLLLLLPLPAARCWWGRLRQFLLVLLAPHMVLSEISNTRWCPRP